MKTQRKQAVPPRSEVGDAEIRDAVTRSARMGEGIQTVARRHGITHQAAFAMMGEAIDVETAKEYRRGYAAGRVSMLPNLPRLVKVAA